MSTILKALRRLEREKATRTESRTLREAVTAGEADPTPGSDQPVWLLPGIALLLGVAVGAGFLLLWTRSEVEAAPATEVALALPALSAVPASPQGVRPALPAPRVRDATSPAQAPPLPAGLRAPAAEAGLPAEAFSSQVEVVPRPAREPRIAAPEVPEPAPSAELAREAPPERVAAQAEKAPGEPDPWLVEPVVAPSAPREVPSTPLPEPPTSRPAETSPPAPRPAEPPLPSAPPGIVESAPAPAPPPPALAASATPASGTFHVKRTWWHPMASRREALVRLEDEELLVMEGQRVGDAVVVQIEPSAVVFSRGEVEFRRRVGESE